MKKGFGIGIISGVVLAVMTASVGLLLATVLASPTEVSPPSDQAAKDHQYAQIVNNRYLAAPLPEDEVVQIGRAICIRDDEGGAIFWVTQNVQGAQWRGELVGFTRGFYADQGCYPNKKV